MFGLDSFVHIPPLSILISVLMILGCDSIGLFVLKQADLIKNHNSWARWQSPLLGVMVLSIFLYPLALMSFASFSIFRILAIILLLAGVLHLICVMRMSYINKTWLCTISFFRLSHLHKILGILLLSYTVFSLSAITNADSLDYHVGVALHILNSGQMPVTPEWFSSRLAGSGEVLNALGFALGAEQFGALFQIAALMSISGLLLHGVSIQKDQNPGKWQAFLTIIALSAPVLVFLTGSVKPQLLPIAMTTLALFLTVLLSKIENCKESKLKIFTLICMLVMTASQLKFSYLLGGGITGFAALIVMIRLRLSLPALAIGAASFMLIMFPSVFWKSLFFNSGLLESLVTPLPGNWYGTDVFEEMLRNYREGNLPFPLSLLIPSGFGVLTTVIGVGILFFVFLKPRQHQDIKLLLFISVVVTVLSLLLGPPTSRSYLEPYFWLLIALSFQSPPELFAKHSWLFQAPVAIQVAGVILMCWYGAVNAIPGMVSPDQRTKLLTKMANGYSLVEWLDESLPDKAVILSTHRSMGLMPRKAVSMSWAGYSDIQNPETLPYLLRIREEGVTHLLVTGGSLDQSIYLQFFSDCVTGDIIGPHVGFVATRNPFNRGTSYNAWLVPIRADLIPNCLAVDF
jgi:hypothetical protein